MFEFDGIAYLEVVGGVQPRHSIAFGNYDGLKNLYVFAVGVLLAKPCGVDQMGKRSARSIHNGQFVAVDLDQTPRTPTAETSTPPSPEPEASEAGTGASEARAEN